MFCDDDGNLIKVFLKRIEKLDLQTQVFIISGLLVHSIPKQSDHMGH